MAGYLGYVPGAPPPAPAPDLAPPSEADIQDLYRDLDLDLRLLQGASTAPSAGSPVHIAADVQARCRRNLATDTAQSSAADTWTVIRRSCKLPGTLLGAFCAHSFKSCYIMDKSCS